MARMFLLWRQSHNYWQKRVASLGNEFLSFGDREFLPSFFVLEARL